MLAVLRGCQDFYRERGNECWWREEGEWGNNFSYLYPKTCLRMCCNVRNMTDSSCRCRQYSFNCWAITVFHTNSQRFILGLMTTVPVFLTFFTYAYGNMYGYMHVEIWLAQSRLLTLPYLETVAGCLLLDFCLIKIYQVYWSWIYLRASSSVLKHSRVSLQGHVHRTCATHLPNQAALLPADLRTWILERQRPLLEPVYTSIFMKMCLKADINHYINDILGCLYEIRMSWIYKFDCVWNYY